MLRFLMVLALVGCGGSHDAKDTFEQASAAQDQVEADATTEGYAAFIGRLDVQMVPYFTFYDVELSGVIVTANYEPYTWKMAYAVSEGSQPLNCIDGDISGSDWLPLTVDNVKPETTYFVTACPINTITGSYGAPITKSFKTGGLRTLPSETK